MLTVRDVMTLEPVSLAPEDSLRLAAEVLTSAEVGGAPVVTGGQVVGIISLTDIVAFEADDPGVPTLGDGLTRFEYDDPGDEAAARLEEASDSIWFYDLWEDVGAQVTSRMAEPDGPEWDPLDEHVVAEAMSSKVVWISPDASATEAARLMEQRGVKRLVVMEDGEVAGIVTTTDVTRAVAKGELVG